MTFTNERQFRKELRIFGDVVLPNQFNKFKRAIALRVFNTAIFVTPVDTGRLRGGWIPSIAAPDYEDAGGEDKDGGATRRRAFGAIASAKAYDDIWINNNVEYASYVNDGTDRMEARQMIERAFQSVDGISVEVPEEVPE